MDSPNRNANTINGIHDVIECVAAMKQVTDLQRDYRQKIDAAAPADKPKLASEGNAALKKAVNDHGLSVDEYNQILTVAQNDPTVRAKLMQRLTGAQ